MPAEMGIDRPIPLTILVVIASLRPKGIPIAITVSPTSAFEEFPKIEYARLDHSSQYRWAAQLTCISTYIFTRLLRQI